MFIETENKIESELHYIHLFTISFILMYHKFFNPTEDFKIKVVAIDEVHNAMTMTKDYDFFDGEVSV